jgi:haloalkane dehalogenase
VGAGARPAWLAATYPWPSHAVTVNGWRMAYVDEGPREAAPVLLLHGNPTWGYLYRDFVGPLVAAGHRVIVPDWIGAGGSDKPRDDARLTLAHHIADLVSLTDQLHLRQFTIVGQDWGGPQGVGAALQRLDRLRALVLMNTWLFTGMVSAFHASPRPWATWHAPLIGQYFMKRGKVLSHAGPSTVSRRGLSPEEARAYHHVYDEPESDAVVLTWPRTIPVIPGDRGWADMQAIERRLGEITQPVLLLWAPEDVVFPLAFAGRLRELLPQAEGPITFDRAAHFLQDDRGPAIAAAIVAWLGRLPAVA